MANERTPSIGIINYGLGNIFSIQQALARFGASAVITSDPKEVARMDALILPGVGAFGRAMENLQHLGLVDPLREAVARGRHLFGICLGMQLLMDTSNEFGLHAGLGIVPGTVERFPDTVNGQKLQVPTIGWNKITGSDREAWRASPLAAVREGDEFYFVHSYCVAPRDAATTASLTSYSGFEYSSALCHGKVFATQFHPEKSGHRGLAIVESWIKRVRKDGSE